MTCLVFFFSFCLVYLVYPESCGFMCWFPFLVSSIYLGIYHECYLVLDFWLVQEFALRIVYHGLEIGGRSDCLATGSCDGLGANTIVRNGWRDPIGNINVDEISLPPNSSPRQLL
jgi:hypothetical protein